MIIRCLRINHFDVTSPRMAMLHLGLQARILRTDIEAGAVLVDTLQLTMSDNLSIRIVLFQRDKQRIESELLGWGAGVGGAAFLIKATLVADADGVGIIMPGVGADHLLGTAKMQLTVAGDVVMVATALPAFGFVHLVEPLHRDVLVRSRCRAVNDNQIYSSHGCQDLEAHAALHEEG